ncbi:hypothetical protein [Levilactobacillus brevis]|uniref:hypothetical protein n=1 Tax=Levilactobacillus brevis TaxID=1580 RepID=UPI002074A61E|nr:hypothetical protein [Levilactobacillus brevis]
MKTTEFVQAIRKMAFGIDKVTCFGEGIIYRIWVPKNQYDSVKVATIWQDKKQKIIEPEGYRAIKDYLSVLEESDLLNIISDYMATPIDERVANVEQYVQKAKSVDVALNHAVYEHGLDLEKQSQNI